MSALAFTRRGAGKPLVLLHGLGSSRAAWDPAIPHLSRRYDVIAVDLPGFGEPPPTPPAVEPLPAALAAGVAGLLDDLNIRTPHIVGNSLGGWVALELAAIREVASLSLLSPAGLWRGNTPGYQLASLRASRWLSKHARPVLDRVVNHRIGRALVLGQTHGRPFRLSPEYARGALRAMGTAPGFDAALRATAKRCYVPAGRIEAPVTVAFGSRDLLLLRRSRRLDELPPHTRVAALPRCGHVPMADDPEAVAAVITGTVERAVAGLDGGSARIATPGS